MCALPPPEESCEEGEFQCGVSKGCVPKEDLCDLADDCGDSTDETTDCESFTKMDFENPEEPFGFFVQNSETPTFKWKRGNGTTSNEGTGPPFDHTWFDPTGHYLFIPSNEHEANEKAWLISPQMTASEGKLIG